MRSAVLLTSGKIEDFVEFKGQRLEFVEIAKALDAELVSFTTEQERHGEWFSWLFRNRSHIGAAVGMALLAHDFDRIYVVGEEIGFPLAVLLGLRRWKGRIVCVVHNMTPRKSRILRFAGTRLLAAFVTVNTLQAEILRTKIAVPGERIINVWNWVDDRFFSPVLVRAERSRPVVVACGSENRDYPTLVAAARLCDADFVVFGHGFFKHNNPDLAAEGLPDNITFMPRVAASELALAYAQADLVVLPLNDVQYAAGVSGLVEAMASGKAIVASRTMGLQCYLDQIDDDLICPPHRPDLLAATMTHALADCERLKEIGARNRALAVENASLDGYVAKIKALMLS